MMSGHLVGVVETGEVGFEVGVTGGADGLGEAGVRVVVGTGDETGVWAAADACTANCPKSRLNLTLKMPSVLWLDVAEAFNELGRFAGTQCDPQSVDILCKIMEPAVTKSPKAVELKPQNQISTP